MTDHADLIARLRAAGDDLMWADHAEVPKTWLREAADALSRPVTEEMVERGARVLADAIGEPVYTSETADVVRHILTAALGTPAAGHETYPGHDPAAGLPQPDAAGGAESLVCAACGGLLREDCGQAANARFSGKPSPCVPMQSFNEASIRAEATAKERERCVTFLRDRANAFELASVRHQHGTETDRTCGLVLRDAASILQGGSHD